MNSCHWEAFVYQGEVYCRKHWRSLRLTKSDLEYAIDVQPIFAGQEWDFYPVCAKCGKVHKYVSLIQYENEEAA